MKKRRRSVSFFIIVPFCVLLHHSLLFSQDSLLERDPSEFTIEDIEQIRKNMPPLRFHGPPTSTEALERMYDFYNAQIDFVNQYFGYIPTSNGKCAVYLFLLPENGKSKFTRKPKGTVFFVHGYMTHSLGNIDAIRFLVRQGWNVAAMDLPGHGFSDGERADIAGFQEYGNCVIDFFQYCAGKLEPTYIIMGHSTGCAAWLEAYRLLRIKNRTIPWDDAILTAPLIRSWLWDLSQVAFQIADPFVKQIPRAYRGSNNKEFLQFLKNDPLQETYVPFTWIEALYEWNEYIKDRYPVINEPLFVVQGKDDTVLEVEYNINFLKKHFPLLDVCWVKKAEHQLFNEPSGIAAKVYSCIRGRLLNN